MTKRFTYQYMHMIDFGQVFAHRP